MGQECPWHRPRTFPLVHTPPSRRDIAELLPGAESQESPEPDMPPHCQ